MSGDVIKIEQRLQDPAKFFFLTADEAVVLGIPIVLGLLGRAPFQMSVLAITLWQGWKYLKGDGGVERVLAATYWYLPKVISPYKGFPDSAVTQWRG